MKTAMILAAGRGERLRPLTYLIPKALCTINQISLIEHNIISLVKARFERIVINHAYLGGLIRRHVGDGKKWNIEIIYCPEPPGGLETLGGIINALPYLGNSWFTTINADIFSDYQFCDFLYPSAYPAYIVLCPNPAYRTQGDFNFANQKVSFTAFNPYIFSGIAHYHVELFQKLQIQRASMRSLLYYWAAEEKLAGEVFHGYWSDIGTLERLKQARDELEF